jgi:hypothetical protein
MDRLQRRDDVAQDLFGLVPEPYLTKPGYKGLPTSREAARAIAPSVRGLRRRVLDCYRTQFPAGMTADEAADKIDISILSVRPRCTELRRMGLLEATPSRRPNESGHAAAVLRATREAMGAI